MRNTFRYTFATALTAGLVLAPFSAAFADVQTDGSGGVASGNQIVVPVDVEANLCGNSLAVLGISKATCTKVSEVLYENSGQGASTDGSGGVASGNQIVVPVDAALNACGNSVAVAGISEAECKEVVEVLEKEAEDAPSTLTTDGSGGVASGNQISVPVDTAIEICGNSIAVLGASSAQCTTIINIIHASPDNEGAPSAATSGAGGVASGNQVLVPVNAAVDICGNAVSVLGIAEASCVETISEKPEEPETPEESEKPEEPKTPEESEKPEEPKTPEESEKPKVPEKNEETDEKPAPPQEAGEELAVTGGALGGLVAAAVAAIGAGGAGLYFARKRRAATADDE
ncbi:chaplin [Nocardiopsis sp. SBT366]|uniref:chaplin n=1 Tax=Nocardiopsis sp. SBT366 TaxID=1580529 RepID=UPI00066C2E49|nr:chaplin [Nocardiopsis sp. SBT366]